MGIVPPESDDSGRTEGETEIVAVGPQRILGLVSIVVVVAGLGLVLHAIVGGQGALPVLAIVGAVLGGLVLSVWLLEIGS
jgi:hypothetical protein